MADTGGKKGKKKKGKGKTINLNEFLASDGRPPPIFQQVKKTDDSEEFGDDDFDRPHQTVDLSKLPTAPKAARGADIDVSKLPKGPPYTAFLGNLPYEVSDEEIQNFFNGLPILNIRLIQEGGRQKGYGYAEFADLASLTQALALNNNPMGNRKLRVDIAGSTSHSQGDGGQRREESREERVSDWRSGGGDAPPGRMNGFSDGDRFSGRGDRGFRDGERGGYRQRADDGQDRGYFGDRDRGGGRDGGFERGFDRGDRGGRGRPGLGGSDADEADCWRRGPEGETKTANESAWRREPASWGRDEPPRRDDRRGRPFEGGRGDAEDGGGFGSSWRGGGGGQGGGGGGGSRQERFPEDDPSQSEPLGERKRLNLKPRSVPAETVKKNEFSASSIFGGARPVDTAAREREIEARITKTTGSNESSTYSGANWTKDNSRSYPAHPEESEDRGEEVWRDDGVKKDRTRVMRPDLLSEEERSPRDRTISTGSERSGDDGDDRPGRVILRKSLSRESKDDEDGVAMSSEGRSRSGSGGRGRVGAQGAGNAGGRGRGSPPGKPSQAKRKEKSSDIGKYEEPPPPTFSKQSIYSVLADDENEGEGDSGNEADES